MEHLNQHGSVDLIIEGSEMDLSVSVSILQGEILRYYTPFSDF